MIFQNEKRHGGWLQIWLDTLLRAPAPFYLPTPVFCMSQSQEHRPGSADRCAHRARGTPGRKTSLQSS